MNQGIEPGGLAAKSFHFTLAMDICFQGEYEILQRISISMDRCAEHLHCPRQSPIPQGYEDNQSRDYRKCNPLLCVP